MLRWVIAAGAAPVFVWGLVRVIDALTCSFDCGNQITLGIVGLIASALSFTYFMFLFSRVQSSI